MSFWGRGLPKNYVPFVPATGRGSARLPSKRNDRLPPAGTILTRRYKGGTVQVRVLEHGLL
jgi:hypothetical protein